MTDSVKYSTSKCCRISGFPSRGFWDTEDQSSKFRYRIDMKTDMDQTSNVSRSVIELYRRRSLRWGTSDASSCLWVPTYHNTSMRKHSSLLLPPVTKNVVNSVLLKYENIPILHIIISQPHNKIIISTRKLYIYLCYKHGCKRNVLLLIRFTHIKVK